MYKTGKLNQGSSFGANALFNGSSVKTNIGQYTMFPWETGKDGYLHLNW